MPRPSRSAARRAAAVVAGLLVLSAGAPASAGAVARILPGQAGLGELDARTGRVAPTAAQQQAVADLGATAQWNRYGTPASLIADGGFLTGASNGPAADVARDFIRAHRDLFRLSASDVDGLELVNDARLAASDGHAVLFRQRFGSLPAGHDGMITVGVAGGRVAYVSSSAAGSRPAPADATLTPVEGWLRGAANAGFSVARADMSGVRTRDGWTEFSVAGLWNAVNYDVVPASLSPSGPGRIATTGGLAPAAATCNAGTVGARSEVPYTADYYFWRQEGCSRDDD